MDVEGMEHEALRGAARLLTTGTPPRALFLELAAYRGERRDALLRFLMTHGYVHLGSPALLPVTQGDVIFVRRGAKDVPLRDPAAPTRPTRGRHPRPKAPHRSQLARPSG